MSPENNAISGLQAISEIDELVHEPARLLIMAHLYVVDSADFTFLMRQTGLTRGNLSSHLSKLEAAGYVRVKKEFVAKMPLTLLSLTAQGREAFQFYRQTMLRALEAMPPS